MALKPFPLNVTITQGDDCPLSWTYSRNGTPEDISTWQFWLTVKDDPADVDANAYVALDPDDFTVDDPGVGTDCRVSCLIPAAATAAMPPGDYYIDLQVTETTLVQTHGKGTCTIEWQTTQRTS